MNGKLVAGFIVVFSAVFGAVMYYMQVYAYYEPVATLREIPVTTASGEVEPLRIGDFQGIDAESSPLRFRACFTVPVPLGTLSETLAPAEEAEPLNGPGWFDCYDAGELHTALESGEAVAFLGQREIRPGVDRLIAVMRDGRGFAWHQLNGSLEN